MEALLVLVVIVLIATPIAVIALWVSQNNLRKALRGLRSEIAELKSGDRPAVQPEKAFRRTTPEAEFTDEEETTPEPEQQPWTKPSQPTPPPLPAEAATPPKSFVFGSENFARLTAWFKENWFIAVAALSLAMAGIFLVQYGIENGILSPRNRVLSALTFGAILIGFAEWIRRRIGDEGDGSAAFLPSTFAGAGVVTLFAAVVSAQQLYGLIGQEVAFFGLVLLAVLSITLGWLYGPFLTVVGILGAVATPFIVSTGTSVNVTWLLYYFALIAAIGLGVDAMKRSAWVSTVGLVVPYIGAALIWLGSGNQHFLGFAAVVAACAVCIPSVQLRPAFGGAMSFAKFHSLGRNAWPEFPTRLAAAGLLALSGVAVLVSMQGEIPFWAALAALFFAMAALAFWLNRTDVLDDLAVPVALAMLAIIGLQGLFDLMVARMFEFAVVDIDTPMSKTVNWLVTFAMAVSALAGWRSLRNSQNALFWALGSAVFAPAVVILIAAFWNPLSQLTPIGWAALVLVVAAMMTVFAEQALRAEGSNRVQVSVFALAALNMIAFAMSILLTETALTLGFAGIAVSAAWLDRKFDLRVVGTFVQLAILACGYRLVFDPGLGWALEASFIELCIGFIGTILLLGVAWFLLQARERTAPIIVAESAIFGLGGIFVCLVIFRALDDGNTDAHWALSLYGTVWLLSGAMQFYRMSIGGFFGRVRQVLGFAFAGVGLFFVAMAVFPASPLNADLIVGPPFFDSLLVAYLLPALVLGAVAWKFEHLSDTLRLIAGILGGLLATLYVGLEIRRLWQGRDVSVPGVMDGELWSYTIVMLLAGSVLLLMAFLKRSALLRKAAIAIIALTIAKVFLIDMSGLEGLIRVLSFLALGLVLAGLAMLNRWITRALEEA